MVRIPKLFPRVFSGWPEKKEKVGGIVEGKTTSNGAVPDGRPTSQCAAAAAATPQRGSKAALGQSSAGACVKKARPHSSKAASSSGDPMGPTARLAPLCDAPPMERLAEAAEAAGSTTASRRAERVPPKVPAPAAAEAVSDPPLLPAAVSKRREVASASARPPQAPATVPAKSSTCDSSKPGQGPRRTRCRQRIRASAPTQGDGGNEAGRFQTMAPHWVP